VRYLGCSLYALVLVESVTLSRFSTEEFACNGSLVEDVEMGQVIQLQGDQRTKIVEILIGEGIGACGDPCPVEWSFAGKQELN
jgi:hypothetical protein